MKLAARQALEAIAIVRSIGNALAEFSLGHRRFCRLSKADLCKATECWRQPRLAVTIAYVSALFHNLLWAFSTFVFFEDGA
jgi:hypothetical protein